MKIKQLESSKAILYLFFAALCLKYALYGFSYFPILDDYIQYGTYPLYPSLRQVFFEMGTMAARPMAGILDPLLWGMFWGNMGFALAFMTLIHFGAGYFFVKTLEENEIFISPLFLILFYLLPLGSEGSYWISASSRIVVGLFFVALSLYCLTKFIGQNKWRYFVLSLLTTIISYGFYESVLVFGFTAALLILIINRRKIKHYCAWSVPFLGILSIAGYYLYTHSVAAMGSRASSFSFSVPKILRGLVELLHQLAYIMTAGNYKTAFVGFLDGLKVLYQNKALGMIYILLAAILSIVLFKICQRTKTKKYGKWLFFSGVLLFLAPLAPHLPVADVWLTYRSIFPILIGLALLAESVLQAVFKSDKVRALILSALLFVFLIGNANEYDTYRRVNQADMEVIQNIISLLDEQVLQGEKDVILLMEKEPYIEQTSYYKDHVKSTLYADWAVTGAVRAVSRNINIRNITPVLIGEEFEFLDQQVLFLNNNLEIQDRSADFGEN